MTKSTEKRKPMKNTTLNIPELYDEKIQYLKRLGLVSSRSEAIREALRELLEKDYEALALLTNEEGIS